MKKINQYLPFILWSISTIILTVLAFIILPLLLILEKYHSTNKINEIRDVQVNQQQAVYSIKLT